MKYDVYGGCLLRRLYPLLARAKSEASIFSLLITLTNQVHPIQKLILILKQKLQIKFDHSNRKKNSYPYVCIIVPSTPPPPLHQTPFRSLLPMKFTVFWLSFTKLFGCVQFTVYVRRSIFPSQGDSTQMLN